MLYPIIVDLEHRPVLIVGGSDTAAEKAKGLLALGAEVRVVDEAPGESVLALAGSVDLRVRPLSAYDLQGAVLVVVVSDDPYRIAWLKAETHRRGQLLHVVAQPQEGSFLLTALPGRKIAV